MAPALSAFTKSFIYAAALDIEVHKRVGMVEDQGLRNVANPLPLFVLLPLNDPSGFSAACTVVEQLPSMFRMCEV